MAIIKLNSKKCRHCYKCVRHCEVKAIMVKDGCAEIIEDNCILCGKCLHICPQSAKKIACDLDIVKNFIKKGEKVVVSIAPAYKGLLDFEKTGQVKSALLKLGFYDVLETAQGAAVVTGEYVKLLQEGKMKNIITTCCPAANDLIEKYYPQLIEYMAPTDSPMIAHGKMIKQNFGAETKVVFLGPCIAKKKESQDMRHSTYVDAVLNFNDIKEWLEEENILINECDNNPFEDEKTQVNALYPVTNGIINSTLATTKGDDKYHKFYVHGENNCIDLCNAMLKDEIKDCFIEINICSGGCVKGSAMNENILSRFKIKLDLEEITSTKEVEKEVLEEMNRGISIKKEFVNRTPKFKVVSEEKIKEILALTGKLSKEDELNCGACGYPTCRDKANAVFQEKAELNMCIPFMHEKSESLANLVMETSPNIIFIVDENMKIIEYSAAGVKYFGKTRTQALQMYLYEFIDPEDFYWVLETRQSIQGKRVSYSEYDITTLQNIVYLKKENAVLATLIDVTKEEKELRESYEKKLNTITLAQDVIRQQMMVAQEIAGLLGETTAQTKAALTTLCDSLLEDGGGER